MMTELDEGMPPVGGRRGASQPSMSRLVDAGWRAAIYCLHWRVIMLSLAPFLVMAGLALALGWFFYEPAIDAIRAMLESWGIVHSLNDTLAHWGFGGFSVALGPLLLVLVSTPVIVVLSLVLVVGLMTPAIVKLVETRRFPALERRHGGSMLGSVVGTLICTVAALVALLLSIPLWLIPPLVLVIPPLIWGWLTYRMMTYDVLAEHASREERRALVRRHRLWLLAMGVVTGYLGAAPSLVWVSGVSALLLAPVLIPLAIWVYMLVFAFSALWFAHYTLAALADLRAEAQPVVPELPPMPPAVLPPA